MKNIGNWFRDLGYKLRRAMTTFMTGRYGTDKLNMTILTAGLVICLVAMFFQSYGLRLALTLVSYGCVLWAMFRTFSRNTYRRYQENRKFLMLLDRIKDREHLYFDCPRCHQPVRVPRGKGKIAITCPRCQEKFVKKT